MTASPDFFGSCELLVIYLVDSLVGFVRKTAVQVLVVHNIHSQIIILHADGFHQQLVLFFCRTEPSFLVQFAQKFKSAFFQLVALFTVAQDDFVALLQVLLTLPLDFTLALFLFLPPLFTAFLILPISPKEPGEEDDGG